jgi:tryptophan synthase alpha chain
MKLLVAYFTVGYPTESKFVELLREAESCGVDAVELGIPPKFAKYDGPLIRRSYERARKVSANCWGLLREARKILDIPMIVLAYLDDYSEAFDDFLNRLREVGADSLLLPDLLIDYVDSFEEYLEKARDVGLTIFTNPSMPDKLIAKISPSSKLFLYYGLRPATGTSIPVDVVALVRRARQLVKNRLVVGFGLSPNDVVKVLKNGADGIAVGSLLIRAIEEGGVEEVSRVLKELRGVIDGV